MTGPEARPSFARARLLPLVAAVLVLLGGLALAGTPLSGATFTSTSNTPVTVNAATDWAPPTVSVNPVSGSLSGSVTISATAADTGTGVASVTLQYSPSGAATWTTLCTTTATPYGCTWNTALVLDGSYDLRATAIDNAGFTTTSGSTTVRVANALGVVLGDIADPAHGTLTLRVDYVNANPTVPLVLSFQYGPAGASPANGYSNIPATCASSVSTATTWTCALDTTKLTNGSDYDFRAVGTTSAKTAYYDYQYAVTIDNGAPNTAITVPAGTLSGTVPLTATASDNETSIVNIAFQYKASASGTWTTACTEAVTPYVCSLSTAGWPIGSYDFRTVATDEAGNTGISAVQTRTVDNTVASVSVTSPLNGAVVRGTATITADASSSKGIASVALQYSVGAGGSWQTICTDTTAPYGCAWDSTVVLKSAVSLRAVMTDGTGAMVTSAPVAVTVDNSVLRAQDIQATNGGVLGRADNGDKLVFTYSGVIDPATLLAGWTGSATPITATLTDAAVAGGPGTGDWMSFGAGTNGNTPVNLGQVAFGENYVKAKKSVAISASMVATTQTVAGQQVTVLTVTLGTATSSAGSLRQTTGAGTMSWTPSSAVRATNGAPCSGTPASETGTADQDL